MPSDRDKIADAVRQLDRDSIYTRLFTYRSELTDAGLDRIMAVDPVRDVMLVVTVGAGADEKVIASGRFIAAPATTPREAGKSRSLSRRTIRGSASPVVCCATSLTSREPRASPRSRPRCWGRTRPCSPSSLRSGLPMRQRREGGVVHVTLSLAEVAV